MRALHEARRARAILIAPSLSALLRETGAIAAGWVAGPGDAWGGCELRRRAGGGVSTPRPPAPRAPRRAFEALGRGGAHFLPATRWGGEGLLARGSGEGVLYLEDIDPTRLDRERALEEAARLECLCVLGRRREEPASDGGGRPAPEALGLAHDLRNQLTLALLELECVRATSGAELGPLARALADARTDCERMLAGASSKPQTVLLRSLLETELAAAARLSRGPTGVRLRLRAPADVLASVDAPSLARCVRNLVTNALEASRVGGAVEVELREELGSLVLEVRDQGRGMSAGELRRCLAPGTSSGSGTGFGTASILACVERMGALLEIESVPGSGTLARLRLDPHGARRSPRE